MKIHDSTLKSIVDKSSMYKCFIVLLFGIINLMSLFRMLGSPSVFLCSILYQSIHVQSIEDGNFYKKKLVE